MLFDSTTALLRSMVDSLERGDETAWDDHLEYGNQCIYELFQMSRPERRKYIGHVAKVFDRASRAIPHVKLMNRAIRQRDRATAIKCGRAAVSEMSGPQPQLIPSAIAPADKTENVVKSTPRVVSIARQRRGMVAKRIPGTKKRIPGTKTGSARA
jgi:hypothetical protein